jgi:hypothetical protein
MIDILYFTEKERKTIHCIEASAEAKKVVNFFRDINRGSFLGYTQQAYTEQITRL